MRTMYCRKQLYFFNSRDCKVNEFWYRKIVYTDCAAKLIVPTLIRHGPLYVNSLQKWKWESRARKKRKRTHRGRNAAERKMNDCVARICNTSAACNAAVRFYSVSLRLYTYRYREDEIVEVSRIARSETACCIYIVTFLLLFSVFHISFLLVNFSLLSLYWCIYMSI